MNGLLRRLIELIRPGRLDDETTEEMSHHVDLVVAHNIARGFDKHEARRRALAEIGGIASAREQVAQERTGFPLEQWAREAKFAARALRRSPGLTVVSATTIGIGIGVSALLFTLINAIVLRPLPYPEPDRLVRIFDSNPSAGVDRTGVASGNVAEWRRRAAQGFDGIAGYYAMGRTVVFGDDADVVIAAQVSQDFFPLLGVPPHIGRVFDEDDVRRATFSSSAAPTGTDPVVLLSHSIWISRFGGEPASVGATILLDRRPFKVVGVMPEGFAMPDASVDLWIPWNISDDAPRDQHYLGAVARLRPDVSVAQAEHLLGEVARQLGEEYPDTNRGWGVRLSTLPDETVGDTARILWILLAAVGLVLLVACANVALLSLIRGLDRRQETAVRLALGASPRRLLRESLSESALLAILGGLVGATITASGLRLLPALTTGLPRLNEVAFDYRAMTFIAGLTASTALLSGLPQAWRLGRALPVAGMSRSTRVSEGVERHGLRGGIVVVQVAIALVLMVGAGLLVRSVLQLRAIDPGYDPKGVLVVPVFLDAQAYESAEKARTYYRTLFDRLTALPGVLAVGGATTVPTSPLGPDFERPVWPQGTESDPARRTPAAVRIATPGYFKAMGLRVVDGRTIDEHDGPQAAQVLMVSETLARRMWPGEKAVGRQLVVDYSSAGTYPYEVVGVVRDVKFRGPRSEPLPEIYLAHAQRPYLILNVVVKSAGDPRTLIGPIRAALKEIDPLKPPQSLHPLEELIGGTYARDRQVMLILTIFAAASIFLALLSVYGVLAQRVRERAHEIGIRMALGADSSAVVGWVAGSGLRLIALGLLLGVLVVRGAAGTLDGLLFGVPATDALTTITVMVVVAAVGTLASLVPSWRATRIDPIQVLRRG